MSERKVLNKYYPPDFDPNKIPKLRRPKNRQFCIRIMAPFNMRCGTCGEYIYKGKKFNSRQEKVEDEDYLGLMIFRFYIKCPRCVSEISFKTDPQNTDYELEAGAIRNFEALRTAEKLAEKELKEKEDEEKNNPMKVLENRTKASRQEMEMVETLEELRELNSRHAKVNHEEMIVLHKAYEEQLRKLQDEEDEEFIKSIFGKGASGETVKRIREDSDDEEDSISSASSTPKIARLGKPSDILVQGSEEVPATSQGNSDSLVKSTTNPQSAAPKPRASWQKSIGLSKKSLVGLVKKKQPAKEGATKAESPAVLEPKTSKESEQSNQTVCDRESVSGNDSKNNPVSDDTKDEVKMCQAKEELALPKATGLGLLGAYSDSSSSSED